MTAKWRSFESVKKLLGDVEGAVPYKYTPVK